MNYYIISANRKRALQLADKFKIRSWFLVFPYEVGYISSSESHLAIAANGVGPCKAIDHFRACGVSVLKETAGKT